MHTLKCEGFYPVENEILTYLTIFAMKIITINWGAGDSAHVFMNSY